MFISRNRYEQKLKEAWAEGYSQAMNEQEQAEKFRMIQEQIDSLADMISKPKPIGFEQGERKC